MWPLLSDHSPRRMGYSIAKPPHENTYREKPVLERLWVAAVWRTPWIVSSLKPRTQLDIVDNGLVSISLSTTEILGLPQLTTLPSEVLQLIRAYSRGSFIWTYPAIKAKAEEMARFDESISKDDGMQYNLRIVKEWHRGQDSELDEDPPESGVFRFTLDSNGLLDIERLSDWPEYKSCRCRTHKYFFIDCAEAQRTWVYFKFGYARMILSPSWPRTFQIWDIPSPPTKGLEILLRPRRTDATCNRTLDLRNITGITFFFYRGTLMGLHAHTLGAVTAVSTVKDTLSDYEPHLVWIHIPIPHGDRIMRFGLRTWRNEHEEPANHHTALLMTTKLAGDFSLGPSFDMEDQNFLFQGTPTVLVHNTPGKGGITLLGIAGDEPQETLPAPRFPVISLSPYELAYGGNAITVDISLKGTVRVDIFKDSSTGCFRGFLLEYENVTCETPIRPSCCTKLFRFPAGDGVTKLDGEKWPICRHVACSRSREAATMHASCYQLFLQHYTQDNPLNGVWVATEWRRPWKHDLNPQHGFELEDSSIVSVSPSIAEALGMPMVWAYLAIKDLAEGISSAAGQDDSQSCMLDRVESWTRGEGAPVISDSTAGDWGIRVTKDRRGIRKTERLVGLPSYALIPPDQARTSGVDFRIGAARIKLSGNGKSVMWDTPNPPRSGKLSFFAPCDNERLCDMRLRTLDLRSTRGLTFFYVGSSLWAIHSHTSRFPTALTTYARLLEHARKHAVWANVPISPNYRLIGSGIRTSGMDNVFTSPSVLVRTKLAGDIVIGPQFRPVHPDFALVLNKDYTCDIIPEFLIYDIPATEDEQMLLALPLYSSPNPGTSPGDHPD
ncbi:hypothetical protein FOVSG1_000388 [Fusarium oxysporum f. sp. vasinfectum]